MKKRQLITLILISLFLVTNSFTLIPKIKAPGFPPPSPYPDQFIGDIFPRRNTTLHLKNVNATITINATDFFNEIGISYDGNFTLFNPETTTNLTINLPFSLDIDILNSTFEVSVDDIPVPFEVLSYSEENLNTTGINSDFLTSFVMIYQRNITLIMSNLTLLENHTYVVRYQFSGSMPNPLKTHYLFFLAYYLETARAWKGNITERVDFRIYGTLPSYGSLGGDYYNREMQISDINGGQSFLSEWSSGKIDTIYVGIRYYGKFLTLEEKISELLYNYIIIALLSGTQSMILVSIIYLIIIRRKKKGSRF